jgi:hypothetical protein
MKKSLLLIFALVFTGNIAFSQSETVRSVTKLNITNTIGRTFTVVHEKFNQKGNSWSIGGSYIGQYNNYDNTVGGELIIEQRTYFNSGNYNMYFMPFLKGGYFEYIDKYPNSVWDPQNQQYSYTSQVSTMTTQTFGLCFGMEQYIGRMAFDMFLGPQVSLQQEQMKYPTANSAFDFPFGVKGVFIRAGISLGLARY